MATDIELVRSWKAGDTAAGRALFERYFKSLRRFFRSKGGDDETTDDLIQRTLLAVVERSPTLADDANFGAYLFTVARHELFALYKKRRRVTDAFDSHVHSAGQLVDSPTGLLAKQQDERILLAALRRIPVDLQIALELYYWEGMRTADLGAVLGIPPSTATTRLSRARELLKREISASASRQVSTQGELQQWVEAIKKGLDDADEATAGDSVPVPDSTSERQ